MVYVWSLMVSTITDSLACGLRPELEGREPSSFPLCMIDSGAQTEWLNRTRYLVTYLRPCPCCSCHMPPPPPRKPASSSPPAPSLCHGCGSVPAFTGEAGVLASPGRHRNLLSGGRIFEAMKDISAAASTFLLDLACWMDAPTSCC